jgi:hypothetical protein
MSPSLDTSVSGILQNAQKPGAEAGVPTYRYRHVYSLNRTLLAAFTLSSWTAEAIRYRVAGLRIRYAAQSVEE